MSLSPPPPYSRSWGSPFPTLPTSLSLSLSFNGGWKRKGSPRTKSTVPASLFFVKLPCVERRRFAALVADINSVISLRSWLPNVFWWVCTFQARGCKGEASGCPASHAFLAFAFQSPENKQKKKMGKLVLQARILMRISALSTSVTKLNYLGSMSMNYATDHMSRRQNLWHERKRISYMMFVKRLQNFSCICFSTRYCSTYLAGHQIWKTIKESYEFLRGQHFCILKIKVASRFAHLRSQLGTSEAYLRSRDLPWFQVSRSNLHLHICTIKRLCLCLPLDLRSWLTLASALRGIILTVHVLKENHWGDFVSKSDYFYS